MQYTNPLGDLRTNPSFFSHMWDFGTNPPGDLRKLHWHLQCLCFASVCFPGPRSCAYTEHLNKKYNTTQETITNSSALTNNPN